MSIASKLALFTVLSVTLIIWVPDKDAVPIAMLSSKILPSVTLQLEMVRFANTLSVLTLTMSPYPSPLPLKVTWSTTTDVVADCDPKTNKPFSAMPSRLTLDRVVLDTPGCVAS